MTTENAIYANDLAELYELAFSYRDYDAKADQLVALASSTMGRPPRSCLELAAGPAGHAIALARRDVRSTALDLSGAMCALAARRAEQASVPMEVIEADMRAFALQQKVDFAFLLLNSIAHCHTFDDLESLLRAVRGNVVDGGVFIVEMQHPKDFVGRGAKPTSVGAPWTVVDGDRTLKVEWGSPDDPYDPVTQLFSAHIRLALDAPAGTSVHEEVFTMRDFTFDEVKAAIRLVGGWSLRAVHGDLDGRAPFDPSSDSWRMVLVLEAV